MTHTSNSLSTIDLAALEHVTGGKGKLGTGDPEQDCHADGSRLCAGAYLGALAGGVQKARAAASQCMRQNKAQLTPVCRQYFP
jgi:hypothetical protein